MTYASSLNLFNTLIILCLAVFFGGINGSASAQEKSGYAPPVMFYDEIPPMVRPETATGNIVEPKVSAMPDEDRPIAPRIIAPKAQAPKAQAPVPPQKPLATITPAPQIIKPLIPVVKSPQIDNVASPKREKPSVIQGPKTMPAIPTANVDTQVLFNGDEAKNAPTIFERNQKRAEPQKVEPKESDTLKPVIAVPKNTSNPATFDKGDSDALKRTIQYDVGQIALAEDITNSLAAGVVGELDKDGKKEWRVQIKSYATPHGTGISSDKRTALSRALSLRSSLITQGVSANKIDVMAEGLQTDAAKSGDRIDLYLYKPAAK